MATEEFFYLTTLTINDRVIFNNKEEVINNLIEFIGKKLIKQVEDINIEHVIDDNIIYILTTTEQEVKIKTSSIKEFMHKNVNNIEDYEELHYLVKCQTKILKNITTLNEYLEQKNKTKYEKQKDAIYKWRESNKEAYLLKQHQYFKNKLSNEEFRKANLQRIKDKNKKLKEELEKQGIIKKVGRPSKYT